ncbi:MAG TPA: type II CAAX endopeptidase family protein [Kofleriaceae bacterium]
MKWRLAIGASSFVLFGVVASAPSNVIVRFAIAGIAAACLIAALMPDYALRFFRDNWRSLLRLLASVGATVLGMIASRKYMSPGTPLGLAQAVVALLEIAYVLQDPLFRRWVAFLTIDQWRAIDAETDRKPSEAGTASWKVLVILVVSAVSLTLQEYIGDRGAFERWFPTHGHPDPYFELKGFAWWSSWRVIGYVIMPLVTIALMRGERIRDYHVSLKGFTKHLWIYVLLFTLITPAVMVASTTPAFRHTYPFYRLANRSYFDLWTWEAFYAAQFVSLEMFFRGFLLNGLRRAFGANAIFVMIVPYCMIHYGKPMPETLGAIGAGIILGTLAMRTKSIWGGVLIHIGVAMTMDVLALRGCPPFGSNKYCGG